MAKKFESPYSEREWRAKRALIFCAFEGTEVQDTQQALFAAYEMLETINEETGALAMVVLMESIAMNRAREYLERDVWGWDEAQFRNTLLCLRYLREHDEVLPELAIRLHI